MPKLSIIILTWNTAQVTLNCVKSIKKHLKNFDYEIIVTDNDSTDNTAKVFNSLKDVIYVNTGANLGFSKGNNLGSRSARGKYLLFLNSDMEVTDGNFTKMVEFMEKNPHIGLVGPAFLNIDGTPQGSVFPPQTITNALKEFWFGQKGAFSKYVPTNSTPVSVNSISGGALLISRELYDQIGGWDERYYFYFEDAELCRQVRRLGLDVYYYPQCRVIHRHGASIAKQVDSANQWRRAIPSSKIYHGLLTHYLLFLITWSSQKISKLRSFLNL